MSQFPYVSSEEPHELADDIRELFQDLAARLSHERRAYSGECHPPLDVLETDSAIEVVVDICGVTPDALRVLFRAGVLLIVGEKAPVPTGTEQSYHLVEREFGRFARAVRVTGAFDVTHARAVLANGELRILLPKVKERRGMGHHVLVTAAPEPSS